MRTGVIVVLLVLLATPAFASWAINANFAPTATTESMVIPYNKFGGLTAARQYSGLVMFETSGITCMYPGQLDDTFYSFTWYDVPVEPAFLYYGMTYSYTGNCACSEGDGRNITELMKFIDNVGFVDSGTCPAYNAGHVYNFVVDLGPVSRSLTLGSGDGGIWDNYGELNVQLTPVAIIPEPSSMLALLGGITIVGTLKRRKR